MHLGDTKKLRRLRAAALGGVWGVSNVGGRRQRRSSPLLFLSLTCSLSAPPFPTRPYVSVSFLSGRASDEGCPNIGRLKKR